MILFQKKKEKRKKKDNKEKGTSFDGKCEKEITASKSLNYLFLRWITLYKLVHKK